MGEQNTRFCPFCGSPLSLTDKVCDTCGSEVHVNEIPQISSRDPPNRNYTHWIFFGLGFFRSLRNTGDTS
jgi:predicted amidophosphoribosyltransferase